MNQSLTIPTSRISPTNIMSLNLPLVRAALEKAESELGANADFNLIIARAKEIAPDSFGNLLDGTPQAITAAVNATDSRLMRDHAIQAGLGELHDEAEAKQALVQYGIPLPAPVQASSFEGKAKALVTACTAKTLDEAFGLVAAADPRSYGDYLKTLH